MYVQIGTTVLSSFIISVLLLSMLSISHAQVRSSSNFQLQSDSINVGGGLSSSTNFVQESTVGEIATGRSTSTNFSLQAGYQQLQEVFLSLSGGGDVIMDQALLGITGGTSNGSTTFTVVTDSPSGYELTIQAENNPAMQRADGASIANYPATITPDFTFVAGDGESYFGFSVEGVDTVSNFLDNGSACNVGLSNSPDTCWHGLGLGGVPMSRSASPNHPNGATTTVKFRVGIGNNGGVESGVYIATTTVTAMPL